MLVFGTEDVAYVGTADYLYIIDIAITGLPFSSPQIDDVIHMEVRGNYLYLINNEGFSIWDVTDKTTPFLTGSISIPYVAEDFYLAGTLAYISVGADGLDVVDITNPYSPVIVGSFDTYTAAVASVIKDNIAYVTYTGDGLLMMDISNLEYPLLIGQYENSSYTYDLKLRDNLVYLTCWEDGFKIINVSDPTSPSLVSSLSGFNAWMVEIYGNYAYVEEINPPNTTGTIRIINIADPSNPFEVSSIQIPGLGYKLVYHNGYLFVACYDSGLRILDVSDPQNPFEASSFSLPKVQDVFIRDNDAFVCASDWPTNSGGFYDLDISNPEVPIVKGYYGTAGFFPNDVSVADTFAYVSDGDDIWLFLLTDSDPVYIDQYRFPDLISSMFSADKYIYISDSKAGLSIYKNNLIENPPITNWEVQTSGITQDIWAVDFTSLTEGWAAADEGTLLHTTNSGDDWQVVPVGGYFDDFRAITFVNENTGWVCGENSVMYKTTKGGQNWFPLSVPTNSVIRAMCFLNESLGWVVTLEDHLILKTTDGGGTWTQQNSGLSGNLHHVGVWFNDENNGFVIGFVLASPNFENYILRTTDGGQNWTSNFNYQYNDFSSIYFANQNVGWIGGLNGFLINTTDAGNTWQIQNSSTNELITCFSFTDENNGWYSGFNGALFQTSDGGNSWFQQEVLIEDHLRSVYFPDEGDGWAVGSNGIILHYHDSITGAEKEGIQAPDNFELSQNYPNPFNPSTTIQYSIPEGGNVSLKIFNTLGEEVANLVNEYQQPGIYKVNFNGENLSSGIYFYRLAAGNFIQTKKMILLR